MEARLSRMVEESCRFLGRMEYRGRSWTWVGGIPDLPKDRGVYFLVSSDGVEKVGSARGRGGLKQRLSGYCRCKSSDDRMDSTDRLWRRVMVGGELDCRVVSVYCIPLPRRLEEVVTDLGRVSVEFVPVLEVEAHYFKVAVECGEPMRLSGASP